MSFPENVSHYVYLKGGRQNICCKYVQLRKMLIITFHKLLNEITYPDCMAIIEKVRDFKLSNRVKYT